MSLVRKIWCRAMVAGGLLFLVLPIARGEVSEQIKGPNGKVLYNRKHMTVDGVEQHVYHPLTCADRYHNLGISVREASENALRIIRRGQFEVSQEARRVADGAQAIPEFVVNEVRDLPANLKNAPAMMVQSTKRAVADTAANTWTGIKVGGQTLANYGKDVWRTRFLRILRVKTSEPETYNIWNAYDPLENLSWVSKQTLGKPFASRLSIPSAVVLGMTVDEIWDNKTLQEIEKDREKNPASSYLLELKRLGAVTDVDEIKKANNHHITEINRFLLGKPSKIAERIKYLQKVGILKSTDEAKKFQNLLYATLDKTVKEYYPTESKETEGWLEPYGDSAPEAEEPKEEIQFVKKLWEALEAKTKESFPNLKPEERSLLRLTLLPEIKIFEKNDLELAVEAVQRPMYNAMLISADSDLNLPYIMTIAGKSQHKDYADELLEKEKRARKIAAIAKLPEERKKFLTRVDVPKYSKSISFQDFNDKKRELNDELDRWEMFLTDWRFRADAKMWREGKLSDTDALRSFEILLAAHIAFYGEIKPKRDATEKDICDILEGGPYEGVGPLFIPAFQLAGDIQNKFKLTGAQASYCEEELLKHRWKINMEAVYQAGKFEKQRVEEIEREFAAISRACRSEAAKSFKSACKSE